MYGKIKPLFVAALALVVGGAPGAEAQRKASSPSRSYRHVLPMNSWVRRSPFAPSEVTPSLQS